MLGVSPDDERSHVKFREKYDLPFTLLADPDHRTAEEYGVWGEKTFAGKTYMGVERSTFVIDADGNVAKELRDVKPATHADDVLAAFCAPDRAPAPARRSDRASSSRRRAARSPARSSGSRPPTGRGRGSARAASTRAGVAAYLAYRAPATYAAAAAVFRQVRRSGRTGRRASLLDVGAGPGVAAWAAVERWPSLDAS